MKVISDTLEPVIERWDDPGDYPSGAGSGPLASYNYFAGVDGEIVLEFEPADFIEIVREEVFGAVEVPPNVYIKQWDTPVLKMVEGKLQVFLTVKEVDGEVVADEPDYDDVGD